MQTPIQLDKTRMLRFGMKNFSMLEKMLNKPLNKIDLDNLTIEDTAKAIWSGLEDKEGITVPMILDIVDDFRVFTAAVQSLGEAIHEATKASEKNAEGAAKDQAESTV